MSSNPYAAPRAAVGDVETVQEFQEIRLWSASGRIGRLRYLAYAIGGTIAAVAVAGVLVAAMGGLGAVLAVLVYIAATVFSILIMIQRSHDMNWTGWTILLSIIPFVGLIWLFKPGTEGVNDYGAPPPPNTTAVKVLGIVLPILVVLVGILAAIAIPAYADYVRRTGGG